MEERNAPVELPASFNLEIKKNDGKETNCINISRQVSMPICFLVKEQAKSLVAIQDLQKRIENIESVQDDVVDSLAEITKFLCNQSSTLSGLNLENSSLNASNHAFSCVSRSDSFSKLTKFPYSSSVLNSPKECDPLKVSSESKGKESALESDKQDSGLDSDCRDIHDNLSLNKYSSKQESGDELLQLLDEISQRTEFLQKQLTVIDQNACLDKVQSQLSELHANNSKLQKSQISVEPESASCLNCKKSISSVSANTCTQESMSKDINGDLCEHFEGKSVRQHMLKRQKRTANKIDSAMVSSILKETNIVDLQRQVLIYLVENAVLQTKLNELEQLLTSKTLESNKIENSLKDEARLLMMENRELRISLDEQKLETNSFKSKILMLERVLQSVSAENHELTCHLGESLGLQKKELPRKFSFGNLGTSKLIRRSSLPAQFSCQNDTSFNCVKSKLLSNTSSYLDITVEEPEQHLPVVETPTTMYEDHSQPVQSSTPIANFTKLKDMKSSVASPSGISNFQTVKKRFKLTEKDNLSCKSQNIENCLTSVHQDSRSETCTKNSKLNFHNFDSTSKFPFNSIIEKLKANSDYRLSKRTSALASEINFSSDRVKSTFGKTKLQPSEEMDGISSTTLRQNCPNKNISCRKGKNIHQRIQDILDRIVSESEETT